MEALRRALAASQEVASVEVIADAKDDNAVSFYGHDGVIFFPDLPNRLFPPTAAIIRLAPGYVISTLLLGLV